MAAALGGLDALAFAGGIGERGANIRSRICQNLEFLGLTLDPHLNREGPPERQISPPNASVPIFIVKTDEEIVVARAVFNHLAGSDPSP